MTAERPYYWILEGREPKACTVEEWAVWFQAADRTVKRTKIRDTVEVSTVFLGLDHSFGSGDAPVLFETMIFGLPDEHPDRDYQERYCTWDEASAGHVRACLLMMEAAF
jgi:hypothetical protein